MTKRLDLHRWGIILGLGFLALFLTFRFGILWYFNAESRIPQDFSVYQTTSERLIRGEQIYLPTDGLPYKYSPMFAYFFRSTFFLLEKKTAAAVWMGFSILSFFSALAIFSLALLQRVHKLTQVTIGILLGIIFGWHGFLENLGYGQADLLLGAGVIAYYTHVFTPEKKRWWRGLLWALLLSTKPHLGLIWLPVGLIFGWRELAFTGGTAASIYLLPLIFQGWQAGLSMYISWFECLRQQQDVDFMVGNVNQALAAVIARILQVPASFGILERIGLGLYLIGLLVLGYFKKTSYDLSDRLLLISYGISGYLIFSPLSWRWFSFFWIPCVLILSSCVFRKKEWIYSLLPWGILALFTKTSVWSRIPGLNAEDSVSYFGLYAWASASLFIATGVLLARRTYTNHSK